MKQLKCPLYPQLFGDMDPGSTFLFLLSDQNSSLAGIPELFTSTTSAIVKTQRKLCDFIVGGRGGGCCIHSFNKIWIRRFWTNRKYNRLPRLTSANSRSACQGEHMEWHGKISEKVQLVKILKRIPSHWRYCTRTYPWKYRNIYFLTVTYFPLYIIHVIERRVAVPVPPQYACKEGSGIECLPEVCYPGPFFSFSQSLQAEATVITTNTSITLYVIYSRPPNRPV
jgi:hypothetical protein